MCVSKAARGDGYERFVTSAKQSAALMFTRVTRVATGLANTLTHLYSTHKYTLHTPAHMNGDNIITCPYLMMININPHMFTCSHI